MSRINLNDCVKQMREEAEATKPTTAEIMQAATAPANELHSAHGATKPQEPVAWNLFPGWLIDHHEGDIISDEGLQFALADMLKEPPVTAPQPCPDCLESSRAIRLAADVMGQLKAKCADLEALAIAENQRKQQLEAELDTAYRRHLTEITKRNSEIQHWKSNHATVVAQARILKERTDMPIERVRAYEKWQETEKRCAALEKEVAHWKQSK